MTQFNLLQPLLTCARFTPICLHPKNIPIFLARFQVEFSSLSSSLSEIQFVSGTHSIQSSILSDKMPDAPFGLRPVVRKVSRTNQDLVGRFEKPPTSYSTSRSTSSSSLLSRSRPGSVKAGSSKTQRDVTLENKVLKWIMSVINEEANTDYDHFIQDGSVLSKVMTSIVFNSVPMEDIDQTWGSNPAHDRVTAVIREIKRYGVVDVFEPEDLIEMKNIPKVTKCLAQLSKLAASDKDNLLNL